MNQKITIYNSLYHEICYLKILLNTLIHHLNDKFLYHFFFHYKILHQKMIHQANFLFLFLHIYHFFIHLFLKYKINFNLIFFIAFISQSILINKHSKSISHAIFSRALINHSIRAN